MKKIEIIIGLLFLALGIQAQEKNNLFHDKEFWSTKPSIEIIEAKIADGNDPTELTSSGFDAVTSAIFSNSDINIIKHLLSKKGNDVNKLTHDGRTYLFWAASRGNIPLMKYLLQNGAKTNILDDKGNSVFMFAATTGQKDPNLYDLLIANGFVVANEKSKDGANPLLLLIPSLKDFSMVRYFESKGVNLNDKDALGNGAFNYTARTGNIEMLKKLIDKGVDYKSLNKNDENAMIFASQGTRNGTNGLEVFTFLENLGIKANITSKDGINPLHSIASRTQDIKIIEYFLNKGVDINQQDKFGNTPFMNAANRNSLAVVQYLLPKVKDINLKNNNDETALTKAVIGNTFKTVEFLINNKANPLVVSRENNNLAYYLVNTYNKNSITDFNKKLTLLKNNGVDFNAKQGKSNTLYHIAIDKLDIDLLKLLTPFKININAKNNDGLTVLHIAAMKAKSTEIISYLLSMGADKSITTEFEETAFDLASENELLQKNNAKLNVLK